MGYHDRFTRIVSQLAWLRTVRSGVVAKRLGRPYLRGTILTGGAHGRGFLDAGGVAGDNPRRGA